MIMPVKDMSSPSEVWRAYDQLVMEKVSHFYRGQIQECFERDGVYLGHIRGGVIRSIKDAIDSAERQEFCTHDFMPGYFTYDFGKDIVDGLNKTSTYFKCDARLSWFLAELLESIRDEVASALGSPWRTLNVRIWDTQPNADSLGPYEWHKDGFVDEIFKAMIYLSPLTEESGGIEFDIGDRIIRCNSSGPGAWALFKNSSVRHRGIPGTKQVRRAIEVTLCRACAFDVRPRHAGLNAHWPQYPWVDVLDGCPPSVAQDIAAEKMPWRRRKLRVALLIIEYGLRMAAVFAPVGEAVMRPLFPRTSERFGKLGRHRREKALGSVARNILLKFMRR